MPGRSRRVARQEVSEVSDLYDDPKHAWMETHSGLQFNYVFLDPQAVSIPDIAHALSHMCRYNGHVKRFYSVAEHCVHLAQFVRAHGGESEQQLVALFHDGAEAYLADVVRPAKRRIPQYMALEGAVDAAVAYAIGHVHPFPNWLKELDTRILVDERAQAMNPSPHAWAVDGMDPLGVRIRMWRPYKAKRMFLREYRRVAGLKPTWGDRIAPFLPWFY